MILISLTRGKFAMVDNEDAAKVLQFRWQAVKRDRNWYGRRALPQKNGKKAWEYLHRFILQCPKGTHVGHEDGNGLNDQKLNLMPCSQGENMRGHLRKKSNATGNYRGVDWNKNAQKWCARITHQYHNFYLGLFETEEEAAKVRDAKARELGWSEVSMNFPR